jgi:hypothetical protein
MFKRYIGDGVYAEYDGYQIVLTTENGYEVTNRIALEPSVLDSLIEYHHLLGELEAEASIQNPIAPGQD